MKYDFYDSKNIVIEKCNVAVEYINEIIEIIGNQENFRHDKIEDKIKGIKESIRHLEAEKFMVAVIGQMKAGKSTLMNAMIFGDETLPSATTPQTAKLTLIKNGKSPAAKVSFYSQEEWEVIKKEKNRNQFYKQIFAEAEKIGPELSELIGKEINISFEQIKDYVATYKPEKGQGHYSSITNLIELSWPFGDRWPKGIEFVDTPGTNDPNELRENVTLDFLHKADAVILLINGNRPGDREDIEFLKKTLLPIGLTKIILVANQIEKIDSDSLDEVIMYLKDILKESLDFWKNFEEVIDSGNLYPISAIRALLGRKKGEFSEENNFYWNKFCKKKGIQSQADAVAKSGIEILEDDLKNFLLATKGKKALISPLKKVVGAIYLSIQKLEDAEKRLIRQSEDMLKSAEQLDAKLKSKQNELNEIEKSIENIEAKIERLIIDKLFFFKRESERDLGSSVQIWRETYFSEIDKMSWLEAVFDIKAKIDTVSTNLAWEIKDFSRKIRNRFYDELINQVQAQIAGDLADEVRKEFGRFEDSPKIIRQISDLGQIDLEANLPSLQTFDYIKDYCSFFSRLLRQPPTREKVKKAIQDQLTSFQEKTESNLNRIELKIKDQINSKTKIIFDEIRNQTEDRISDIRKRLEQLKEKHDDDEKEQQRIKTEIENLKNYQNKGKDFKNEIVSLMDKINKKAD
jgi:tRNA U34 5-carboxymethylaminomethyl modifying GTPase MnmE/TrmE